MTRRDGYIKTTDGIPFFFGVPDLDGLLGHPNETLPRWEPARPRPPIQATKVGSIEGPVGCGKSTLALHAAAYYSLFYKQLTPPLVLFISTDWRFAEAKAVWTRLRFPTTSGSPQTDRYAGAPSHRKSADPKRWKILRRTLHALTLDERDLEAWIVGAHEHSERKEQVHFLDLSICDVGDEWSFVKRLLTLLPTPRKQDGRHAPPHLVVIDSVPGLETLTGGVDAFGTRVEIDAHINHLIRILHGKANLLFTTTRPQNDAEARREESQTDIIYRLQFAPVHGQSTRTVRVVKARGFWHPMDEHPLEIRSSHGGYSSSQEDADNPHTKNEYLQCFPSVSSLLTAIKVNQLQTRPLGTIPKVHARARETGRLFAAFGVEFLDGLAGRQDTLAIKGRGRRGGNPSIYADVLGDRLGVPTGRIISLTGERESHKSLLGLAFARYQFAHFGRRLIACFEGIQGRKMFSAEPKGRTSLLWDLLRREVAVALAYEEQQAGSRAAGAPPIQPRAIFEKTTTPSLEDFSRLVQKHTTATLRALAVKIQIGRRGDRLDERAFTQLEERLDRELDRKLALLPGLSPRFREELMLATRLADLTLVRRQAIVVTTRYMEFGRLVQDFAAIVKERHDTEVQQLAFTRKLDPAVLAAAYEACLCWAIGRNLRFRRVVGPELNPPVFFNVVRRQIEGAIAELMPYESARHWLAPIAESERLRLVIDDLKSVHDVCDREGAYTDLLALLTTYLRNQNSTAVLIESHGSEARDIPTGPPEDRVNIRTWRVQFQTGDRVAVAIEPAQREGMHGIVRELKVELRDVEIEAVTRTLRVPLVDPDFELYTNLPAGTPQIVPLEVKLYAETPPWRDYIEQENRYIGEVLHAHSASGADPSATIVPVPPDQYGLLKQLCTVPYSANQPVTVVLQVDEFWATRGASDLRDLRDYLTRDLTTGSQKEQDIEDPVHSHRIRQPTDEKRGPQRADDFCSKPQVRSKLDRVPFTWDFGFMMVDWDVIARYSDHQVTDPAAPSDRKVTIGAVFAGLLPRPTKSEPRTDDEVWRRLLNELAKSGKKWRPESSVGWGLFLQACRTVADLESRRTGVRVVPLALTPDGPNCIDSLVLEIWLSEILLWMGKPGGNPKKMAALLEQLAMKRSDKDRTSHLGEGLIRFLSSGSPIYERWHRLKMRNPRKVTQTMVEPDYALPLYLTWLLLIEALDLNVTESVAHRNEESTGVPATEAKQPPFVACRHWYKTASYASQRATLAGEAGPNLTPIALPGRFSMRGDWYLGIAAGSRSMRLGELALDVMTSVPANRRRLELGLGLPMRPIAVPPEDRPAKRKDERWSAPGATPTAVQVDHKRSGGRLSFASLRAIGGQPFEKRNVNAQRFWLWRSGLGSYDSQSDVFKRWLHELCEWTKTYWFISHNSWEGGGGFPGYSSVHREGKLAKVTEFESFLAFAKKCDDLVAELRSVTPSDPAGQPSPKAKNTKQ